MKKAMNNEANLHVEMSRAIFVLSVQVYNENTIKREWDWEWPQYS